MSIKLPIVDMTGKTVGQSGQINVKNELTHWNIPGHTGDPATIRVLNESGCGLGVWTDTNQINEWLGAGAWIDFEIEQGTLYFNWVVQYTIPNPPANQLMITFYSPGERVPPMATLGNSPIGGGTTTAVTGSTLSSEVNATPALIIDIGQVANTNLINVFSDGSFTWNVLQAGVVHTLMKGQITGNELVFGQIGDVLQVLSNLLVSGSVTTDTLNDSLGNSYIAMTAGTVTRVQTTPTGTIAFQNGGANMATMSAAAGLVASGPVSGNGFKLNAGSFNYGLYKNSISRVNSVDFTPGALTGSIAHGLGAIPSFTPVIWCSDNTSTATCAVTSYDATNVFYRVFTAGIQYSIFAMRY
jgi:hypothetical protein